MIRRMFWFLLGWVAGVITAWQVTQILNKATPQSVAAQVKVRLDDVTAKAGAFVRDFSQALRESEADLRRQHGLPID